jgi:hypothetical protein
LETSTHLEFMLENNLLSYLNTGRCNVTTACLSD